MVTFVFHPDKRLVFNEENDISKLYSLVLLTTLHSQLCSSRLHHSGYRTTFFAGTGTPSAILLDAFCYQNTHVASF